jgi:hypothetical protein
MAEPWTRDETLASGQVFEFRVWAALTEQSRGQLHVFLPLSDRGIDGMIHRLSDGAYIPVQAKGRSTVTGGDVHLFVWAASVADDSVLIVAGQIVEGGLGPALLVVPAADFRRLAELSTVNGRPVYSMAFGTNLRFHSRWMPWLVPSDRLLEKFGVTVGPSLAAPDEEGQPFAASDLGFLGESEVIRRLAEADDMNLFRPFPDSETAEILVRHRPSGRVLGLQVKTVTVDAAHPRPSVNVRISSFRPAPTTYFTVLAWIREEHKFHAECLVFPSERLLDFAQEKKGHFAFEFSPGSKSKSKLDRYRRALTELRSATEDLLVIDSRDP